MDTLEVMNGLNEAAKLLDQKSRELSSESMAIWVKVSHASKYVSNQLKDMLSAE